MKTKNKMVIAPNHFADDLEKVDDFMTLSKEDFLNFYGYLKEEDYNETHNELVKRGIHDEELIE